MKTIIKAILKRTPYRVVRASAKNRFDAIEELMQGLRDRGFRPTRVVDGGANIGDFSVKAKSCFPAAIIDMIEPQPACREALQRLQKNSRFVFHPVALVGPSHKATTVRLNISPGEITTGAHITDVANETTVEVPAMMLDGVIAPRSQDSERIFLKLDLQGYELEALSGGEKTLEQTEVILTEVSFFAQAYEPPIADLIAFLYARKFYLYDVAALSSRGRDGRARQGDFIFVRWDSPLLADTSWS